MNSNILSEFHFKVYAGYHQFYLEDKNFPGISPGKNIWKKKNFSRMIACEHGMIGIGTGSYDFVPVSIKILPEPLVRNNFDYWDYVAEAPLDLSSGWLLVYGCTEPDPSAQIEVEPGIYRVSIFFGGLKTVVGERGDDFYRIEIWKSVFSPVEILKDFEDDK